VERSDYLLELVGSQTRLTVEAGLQFESYANGLHFQIGENMAIRNVEYVNSQSTRLLEIRLRIDIDTIEVSPTRLNIIFDTFQQ
jgi:hypothetical protein